MAENEKIAFPDSIGPRGVVRHLIDGIGKVSPMKRRHLERGRLNEKLANLFEKLLSPRLHITFVDLSHGRPDDPINLEGVGLNDRLGARAFPDPDKKSSSVTLEGLAHGTYALLLLLPSGQMLSALLLRLLAKVSLMNAVVSLGCMLQDRTLLEVRCSRVPKDMKAICCTGGCKIMTPQAHSERQWIVDLP